MKLHLEDPRGIHVVQAVDAGGIVINETRHRHSLVVSAQQITPGWPVASANAIDEAACQAILAHDAEIVLIGTGARHVILAPRLHAWFAGRGMGLEIMDTAAACRTYNVLAGEARRVVAALVIETGEALEQAPNGTAERQIPR